MNTSSDGQKLVGKQCQCTECGELFTTLSNFDMHRSGAYALPGHLKGTRGCLSTHCMMQKGLSKNPRGLWQKKGPIIPRIWAKSPAVV